MKGALRLLVVFLIIVIALAFLFYMIGFGLQLIGFSEVVGREGFRNALAGENGSDAAYYTSIAWLIVALVGTYGVPFVLLVLVIRHYRWKKRNQV